MLQTEIAALDAVETPRSYQPAGLGFTLATGAAAVLVAACIASAFTPEKDERYYAAVAFARANPAVVAEVGQVNRIKMRRTIATQAVYLFSRDRVYQFRVCGPNGSAKVVVQSGLANSTNPYKFTLKEIVR